MKKLLCKSVFIILLVFGFSVGTVSLAATNTTTKKSTTKAAHVKAKNKQAPKKVAEVAPAIEETSEPVSEKKFNVRTNVFELIRSKMINLELDYGYFNDAVTVGPTLGLISTSVGGASNTTLIIGARGNYYLNKKRYTTGIVTAASIAFTSFSLKTDVSTASTSSVLLKGLGLYQWWLKEKGLEDLNLSLGLGITFVSAPSTVSGTVTKTGTAVDIPNSTLSGIDYTIEMGVGYRF